MLAESAIETMLLEGAPLVRLVVRLPERLAEPACVRCRRTERAGAVMVRFDPEGEEPICEECFDLEQECLEAEFGHLVPASRESEERR